MNNVNLLRRVLPPEVILSDPEEIEPFRRDGADLVRPGTPLAVLLASTVEEVSTILEWATATRTVVVPRGAGSGLAGGAAAIDDGVILSLERMRGIRDIDVRNRSVVVEAGVVTSDINEALAQHGLFYPPDPGSFDISTIGGNLATNAGGMSCLKYGVTGNSVLGLDVVLADGRTLRTGGKTVKDVAGLDLTRLFVGSEGTLCVITSATLKLQPIPEATATFCASFSSLATSTTALDAIFASRATPSVLEIMDRTAIKAVEDRYHLGLERDAALLVIGQADGPGARNQAESMLMLCRAAGAQRTVLAEDADESAELMRARRLAGYATMELGTAIIEDVGVPRGKLIQLLSAIERIAESSGLMIGNIGHAGDGNLHPILVLPDLTDSSREKARLAAQQICAAALELGGTITGEHGVGQFKLPWLGGQLDETSREIQTSIKAALDPLWILNPGRGF